MADRIAQADLVPVGTSEERPRGRRWTRAAVLRAAGLTAAAAAQAACGADAGGRDQAQSAGAAIGKTPVALQMFNQSGAQQDVDDWNTMLKPFTEKYANVTVDVSGPTSGVQMVDKALSMGASGQPPDLTYSVTRNGPTLANAGLTEDMASVVKREKIDLKDVAKPVLENFDWKGKMLALPYDPGYAFIEFNTSLFDTGGASTPGVLWADKKWDWNAFRDAGLSMARPTSSGEPRYAFMVQTWEGDYVSFLRTLGGDLLNQDRRQLALGDGPSLAALTAWGELVTRQKIAQVPGAVSGAFTSGLLAMYSSHPGNIRPIQKYVKDNNARWSWDVVPHPAPAGKKPVPVLFTNGLYLWKGSKNQTPAVEVLKFLMTDESMLRYGALTGRDPARTTLMDQQMKNLGIPENDPKSYLTLYRELTSQVRGLPWTVAYVEWHTIVQNEILLPIAKGEKSAQEAVAAAAPAVNAILARS